MSEWQPIESAPKDGTRVLLGLNYKGRSIVTDDNWSDEHDQWVEWYDIAGDEIEPSHWMPLTPVPALSGGAA